MSPVLNIAGPYLCLGGPMHGRAYTTTFISLHPRGYHHTTFYDGQGGTCETLTHTDLITHEQRFAAFAGFMDSRVPPLMPGFDTHEEQAKSEAEIEFINQRHSTAGYEALLHEVGAAATGQPEVLRPSADDAEPAYVGTLEYEAIANAQTAANQNTGGPITGFMLALAAYRATSDAATPHEPPVEPVVIDEFAGYVARWRDGSRQFYGLKAAALGLQMVAREECELPIPQQLALRKAQNASMEDPHVVYSPAEAVAKSDAEDAADDIAYVRFHDVYEDSEPGDVIGSTRSLAEYLCKYWATMLTEAEAVAYGAFVHNYIKGGWMDDPAWVKFRDNFKRVLRAEAA